MYVFISENPCSQTKPTSSKQQNPALTNHKHTLTFWPTEVSDNFIPGVDLPWANQALQLSLDIQDLPNRLYSLKKLHTIANDVASLPLYAAKHLAAYFLYSLHKLHNQFSQLHVHMAHWLVHRKMTEMSREQFKRVPVYFLRITV